MPFTVLLRLKIKPEFVAGLDADFAENLPDTRNFDGCHDLVAYRNQDNPAEIIEVQRWESKPHYDKYITWRTESGTAGHLISMLAEPPEIQFFDAIWPDRD